MAKGGYKSNLPRKLRRLTDEDRLKIALKDCLTELKYFGEHAICDHQVGICYCNCHHVIEQGERLLASHERSDRFIEELRGKLK
jgi:hypothetical protein